jgi:trehalose-6-phosphate synthase/Kef-type K+ transport system membrane component KefB
MKRIAALVLTLGAVIWVRTIGVSSAVGSAGTALALGFTLVGAWLTGDLLRRFNLPRLTGYLAFGILVGPYIGNVINESMAGQLQVISGIATTLIALIAGLTLNFNRMRHRLVGIVRATGVTLGSAMIGLALLLWIAWPLLPIAPEAVGASRLAMVIVLVIVLVSFSPTMTAAVITDTGARGRFSETILTMVVLADLLLLILFSVGMQTARAAFKETGAELIDVVVRFIWEIGGAIAFGALVGALFALYMRYIGREVTLVLLGVCAVLSQVGSTQEFEPLLAAVAAGLVIENLAVAQGDTLRTAVQRGAPPVLVVFFAAVGASLRLDAVAAVGYIVVALAVLRFVVIYTSLRVGWATAGLDQRIGKYAWTGLISQAGITLGFGSVIAAEFPGWGTQIQLLLVGLIAIHEIVGPIAFRQGLARANEIDAQEPRPLMVVSNREPYLHNETADGEIVASAATGGVAIALDALMRERGGVWIAHGAGSADDRVVDAADHVRVPPENPSYTLRRLWIEESTFSSYYGGFANEGLWPLCHVVDVRPKFRSEDWVAYKDVNGRFAAAVHAELGATDAPVFIQDYHLALVAPALRTRRPDVKTALFWHIPWPSPDRLRICPWRAELLAGLLGNDLLAFQLDRDRDNFLRAVEEEIEADVETESSRVTFAGHSSTIISVPIGVDYDRIQAIAADPALPHEQRRLYELLGLRADIIGLGVDRLDYTKGIPERLAAIDALMTRRPELRGRLTFVQIGVPSRSELESYSAIESEISRAVADVNARHALRHGPPVIVYHRTALTTASLVALYRLAHFCVVSSLHDGMNLVAKEFVAARDDEDGVLVLSALAGAAQELQDALIINPYDVEGFADALARAIEMPREERLTRMRAQRRVVAGRNVFGWASDILDGLESLWTKPLHYSVRGWEDMSV